MIDFHMHSYFSDGVLGIAEILRRAKQKGYRALAVTDHCDAANMLDNIKKLKEFKKLSEDFYDIDFLVGIELTHIIPAQVSDLAARARDNGAQIIVLHGETIVEPVMPGTNLAGVQSDIDILAHPGFISDEAAQIAAENGVYLEITSRAGHSYTNGYVAKKALEHGAKLLVDTDSHQPSDLITIEFAKQILLGAGLDERQTETVFSNAQELLEKRK